MRIRLAEALTQADEESTSLIATHHERGPKMNESEASEAGQRFRPKRRI